MSKLRAFALLLAAAPLAACEKNAVQEIAGPVEGAMVKFFNYGVGAPAVNFYSGTTKLTAVNSSTGTESRLGTSYGFGALLELYVEVPAGQNTLMGRISDTTDKDLAISSVASTLEAGKRYTFYQSGSYNSTAKTVDAFLVEDPLPAVDYSVAYVRFVHAIGNANPMTLYVKHRDTTVTKQEVAIGSQVAYKAAGAFTAIPGGSYDMVTRYAGATTSAISPTNISFGAGRVYTITARGDITVTSTTASTRPLLVGTANR